MSFVVSAALLTIGCTVAAYWYRVMRMAAKARRRTGRAANIWPAETLGRFLRLLWTPAILVWIVHPLLSALNGSLPWLMQPIDSERVAVPGTMALAAAGIVIICFVATLHCWRRMGQNWRMGIDPSEKTSLVDTGAFARVRHPIYSLSAIMMAATVVALPTPLMLAAAAVHIVLLIWESRREEQHLLRLHGAAYEEYRSRVGRFLPRLGTGGGELR